MTTTTFSNDPRFRVFGEGGWTEEAYLALETYERIELLDGSLYVFPRPLLIHQYVSGRLFMAMIDAAEAQGLVAYQEVCLRLGQQRIVCPDLVVVEANNPDERVLNATLVRLVVEITSPSNAQHDRVRKMRYYAEAGIDWYLLVEPHPELTLRLFQRQGEHYVLRCEAGTEQTLRLTDPIKVELNPARLVPQRLSALGTSTDGTARL